MDIGVTEGTEGAGGNMVFVKVRETYDLHTVKNKMTIIGIHTPDPKIIQANFPGLLMQCKMYRPVSADVRIACASTLPLDPLGVGTSEGDVAPEDLFNPILYKATSNLGMSQIESRITALAAGHAAGLDVNGPSAAIDVDTVTTSSDEFSVYYGLLSNAHEWRHANPQSGLEMTNLRPLVYEMLYNVGDNSFTDNVGGGSGQADERKYTGISGNGDRATYLATSIRGNGKPLPFMNCTAYTSAASVSGSANVAGFALASGSLPANAENFVPWINCVCGAIIIPPSRLHELFYRMVVEWTIEFSSIRPIGEITTFNGLSVIGDLSHYQNYNYSQTKEVVTGTSETLLEKDAAMVSANVDIKKVM